MSSSSHRYFVAWPDRNSPLIELDGPSWTPALPWETRYPLAILAEAEKNIRDRGLHFYLTKDPDRLPEYGPNTVAVMLQEERCKFPAYACHVRAVVRNLQTYPYLGYRPMRTAGRLEFVLAAEYARDWALHLRSRSAVRRFARPGAGVLSATPRMFTIPLGYHSQDFLSYVPMRERKLDTFFAGDVKSSFLRKDYRYWLSTSKIQARSQLWNVLEALKQLSAPDGSPWRILRDEISADRSADNPQIYGSYSERMMQSRICLAPRGSVAETFRLYEGLRAGCLVITNHLPDLTFLRGAPLLFVDCWQELPGLLDRYARDLEALERYSSLSLQWWDQHCSERVFGENLANFLNQSA